MRRFTRRKALQTICAVSSLTLAGCAESTAPTGTDTPTPASSSTPTASPAPTATTISDFPFETLNASECPPVTLPQPSPTSDFQPRWYPLYPRSINFGTAEDFARSFERVYEYNRYLAEDIHSRITELSYNPSVAEHLTESTQDGFLVGVEGLQSTLDGEVYSDDPVVGVYFLTLTYALRGSIEQPTLDGIESLQEVEVAKQLIIECRSSPSYKRPDDFYIENRDSQSYRIELTVARENSEENPVIKGYYEIPGQVGVVFRRVGEYDTDYTVVAELLGGNSVNTGWGVGCAEEMFSPGVGTNGGVVVENGSLYFTQNECDYAALGSEMSEYVSPEKIELCTASETKSRVLAAEEAYITDQLENASCVEEWGLTDYGGWGKGATVISQSADGVYVKVRHPYWYGTGELESDGGSEATYLVTDDETQRLSGTNVTPC